MTRFLLILSFVITGSFFSLRAQDTPVEPPEEESSPSLFDWLYSGVDTALELTLETDVRQLIRKKQREEYQKATIKLHNIHGETYEKEIKIRARGNRRKQVCFYPPIKLKFKKSELEEAGFSRSNDIKLVIQCRDSDVCGDYTSKEYLAYKLYGMVSPYHFRVQMLKVTLVDTRGKGKTREMRGFLIEPEEEMAERLNAELVERNTMRSSFVSNQPHQMMAIFQYMIGNTDWAIGNSHNLKFLKVDAYPRMVPIPYDFDYAGLVNTDYAVPFHTFPIESVTERLYRGIECTSSEIPLWVAFYKEKEQPIMDYVRAFPFLSDRAREEVIQYLEGFFSFLDNPRRVQSVLGSD